MNRELQRIAEIKSELENFEIDQDKHEETYKDLIDELDGVITVASIKFCASRILEELDPVAFRCGLNDYVDSLEITEDEDYRALESELSDLEDKLSDLGNV